MSVLVVGASHKSAPVAMLERLVLDHEAAGKLLSDVAGADHVVEATVISTCNRVEVYAEVDRFHGSVEEVSRLLSERAGIPLSDVVDNFYVHYDQGAVSHLFQVAAGLDSMAVGESQILGQTRDALRLGQELGTVGPALNLLFQQALRVGKRAHAETDIDQATPSLVTAALALAVDTVKDMQVVIVGAGSMAGLAAATISRAGPAGLVVVNRSDDHAEQLAAMYGARWAPLSDLAAHVAQADLVLTCTGSTGVIITPSMVVEARIASRAGEGQPAALSIVDLALPHDVDPAVADLTGVTLVNLETLARTLSSGEISADIESVRGIVMDEVASFMAARRRASVTPTVVALRSMATTLVDTEMARLDARLPDLDAEARAQVLQTMRRVADKLLHQPTVRVRELADTQGAVSYAAALAELFALDPEAVAAVTRVEGLE